MYKKIKNILFLIIVFNFIFLVSKYYFSDQNAGSVARYLLSPILIGQGAEAAEPKSARRPVTGALRM